MNILEKVDDFLSLIVHLYINMDDFIVFFLRGGLNTEEDMREFKGIT